MKSIDRLRTLDIKWFKQVRDEFKSHCFYDKEKDEICDGYDELDYDTDESGNIISQNTREIWITATLQEYCWEGVYCRCSYCLPTEDEVLKANVLVYNIINEIKPLAKQLDLEKRFEFIKSIIGQVKGEFQQHKEYGSDRTSMAYKKGIKYLSEKTVALIQESFKDTLLAYETINTITPLSKKPIVLKKASSILTVSQSALLFYYLQESGVISNSMHNKQLADHVSALTGHSAQNIRTDKGLGNIPAIKTDRCGNISKDGGPNQNLTAVKNALLKIVQVIDADTPDSNKKK